MLCSFEQTTRARLTLSLSCARAWPKYRKISDIRERGFLGWRSLTNSLPHLLFMRFQVSANWLKKREQDARASRLLNSTTYMLLLSCPYARSRALTHLAPWRLAPSLARSRVFSQYMLGYRSRTLRYALLPGPWSEASPSKLRGAGTGADLARVWFMIVLPRSSSQD